MNDDEFGILEVIESKFINYPKSKCLKGKLANSCVESIEGIFLLDSDSMMMGDGDDANLKVPWLWSAVYSRLIQKCTSS